MAGYNIEQVNIPALLGLHQQMKQQGLENMYRAEQIARQRRIDAEADGRRELYKRLFAPSPASSPAPAAASAPNTPAPPSAAPASDLDQFMPGKELGTLASGQDMTVPADQQSLAPSELVDPGKLPPRTDGISINQDALRELYAVDPEGAFKIQQNIYDMDKATAERIAQRGTAMAQVAGALQAVPPGQRAQAFREQAPQLLALGFTPEQLGETDLSDEGLNRYYRAGMSMEQLIADRKEERRAGESLRDYELRVQNAEESRRHNRASEGIAGGNLALSRQREARVTKWGPQAIIVGGSAPRTDTGDLDY